MLPSPSSWPTMPISSRRAAWGCPVPPPICSGTTPSVAHTSATDHVRATFPHSHNVPTQCGGAWGRSIPSRSVPAQCGGGAWGRPWGGGRGWWGGGAGGGGRPVGERACQMGWGGLGEERRRSPPELNGHLRSASDLGPGHGRHLREPCPRPRDDLSGHRCGELRPGLHGHVQHVSLLVTASGRPALLGRFLRHHRDCLRGWAPHRAHGDPSRGERAHPHHRHRDPRPRLHLHERGGLDLFLYPKAIPEPVPEQAPQARPGRARRPRRGGHLCHPRRAGAPLPLLPLHHPRPRHARGGPRSELESPLRHPRGLDARPRLGTGRGLRRGGRHDGRPRGLPRPQHDGRHPDLRVRGGHRGRLHQPAGRGGGRPPRRRGRKSRGHLRELHRHRAQAHGGPGHDHHRAARQAEWSLRPGVRAEGLVVAAQSDGLKRASLVVVLAVACALPFVLSGFRVFQWTQVCIYAIALLGLNILTGYNGQFSLGHGAFYAIGAYTTAIMIDRWNVGYGWTIPIAGVLCLVVGFLFGWPALRLEGLYLALATFSLALALPQILKYFEHWTGG